MLFQLCLQFQHNLINVLMTDLQQFSTTLSMRADETNTSTLLINIRYITNGQPQSYCSMNIHPYKSLLKVKVAIKICMAKYFPVMNIVNC